MARPRIPTDPELWERLKDQARATSLGSEPGRWSEQKSLAAQVAYHQQGGRFRYKTIDDFSEEEIEATVQELMETMEMDREQAEAAAVIALTGQGDVVDLSEEDDGE